MVAEAEKFKEEDKQAREKVDARNSLESYAYQVKNSLSDEKLKDKFTDEDRTAVNEKADDSKLKADIKRQEEQISKFIISDFLIGFVDMDLQFSFVCGFTKPFVLLFYMGQAIRAR